MVVPNPLSIDIVSSLVAIPATALSDEDKQSSNNIKVIAVTVIQNADSK